MKTTKTPAQAVDALEQLHSSAVSALIGAVRRFAETGVPPTAEERARFRYPELRVTYEPNGPIPKLSRAYGQLSWPGEYAVTITQPGYFRRYLIEQLTDLVQDYAVELSVRVSETEIPYPFVLEAAEAAAFQSVPAEVLARHFPTPRLAQVGDAVVDGIKIDRLDRLAAAGAVRCAADRLLAEALAALYWRAVAGCAAVDPVHELPALCRGVRALGG